MTKREYDGPILEIDNLSISFFTRLREIPAVMDFSVSVKPGEAVGLVGESGCGKSTVALGVMQDLGANGRVVGGSIKFKGRDLSEMSDEELRDIRGSQIAMIYQEPMASLNPAMRIGKQLMEVPMIHAGISEKEAYARALQLVTDVKLPDPERILKAYPHQRTTAAHRDRDGFDVGTIPIDTRRTYDCIGCDCRGGYCRSGQGFGPKIRHVNVVYQS